ncbi:hypothetical protein G7Z17_g527 [Cylindrodendrum hubeiense]|uniref:Uncharacterized protein n=1 Tax=Cylindrodendrum hubeiense TaxID=595255 RepID=A0A9P5HHJ6_9HYPO|nr:hypothetical protein G7Z17_g527 [Cylindrodendrum hubeiense]
MSAIEANDVLRFGPYNEESEEGVQTISWSQSLRSKTATYYIVMAENTSKGNSKVLVYVQDSFYKDEASAQHISNIPGAKKDGDDWLVTVTDRFQYGQNSKGENRWAVLHDKNNKMYQHRFIVSTMQGNAAEWAKKLAGSFGGGELADQVHSLGSKFVGDYLHTF